LKGIVVGDSYAGGRGEADWRVDTTATLASQGSGGIQGANKKHDGKAYRCAVLSNGGLPAVITRWGLCCVTAESCARGSHGRGGTTDKTGSASKGTDPTRRVGPHLIGALVPPSASLVSLAGSDFQPEVASHGQFRLDAGAVFSRRSCPAGVGNADQKLEVRTPLLRSCRCRRVLRSPEWVPATAVCRRSS